MQIKWPEFGRVESGLCCGRQSLSGRAVQDSEQQRGQDCVRGFLSCSVGRSLGWPEWLLEPWRDGCFLLFHANLLGSFCVSRSVGHIHIATSPPRAASVSHSNRSHYSLPHISCPGKGTAIHLIP